MFIVRIWRKAIIHSVRCPGLSELRQSQPMKTIQISTYLDAPPETVRDHALRSEVLEYIAKGMLRFKPIEPDAFPEVWRPGNYRVMMYWKGILPIGWQMIVIEPQPMRGEVWSMRDNGYGALIKTWDHMIEISPDGAGTHYVDKLTIDAGLLTPVIAIFAGRFYRHRQKRWRRLVSNQFDCSQ